MAMHTTPASLLRQAHSLAAMLCCALLFLVTACIDDSYDITNPDTPDTPTDKPYMLQLVIDSEASTRANNPYGGEGGNSHETGADNEKVVNQALVLLYRKQASSNDKEARDIETNADKVRFDYCIDFTGFTWDGSKSYWKSSPIRCPLSVADYDKQFNVITLVNLNSIEKQYIKDHAATLTLKDLRDRIYTYKPWEESTAGDPSTAHSFVMTSEKESDSFTLNTATDDDAPSTKIMGNISVRRLAARIDVKAITAGSGTTWVTGAFLDDEGQSHNLPDGITQGYLFKVKTITTNTFDGSQTETDQGNRFLLTAIKIENDPKAAYGTYYIKRTTQTDKNFAGKYIGPNGIFGYETATSSAATNWVIDTHCTEKYDKTANEANYNHWYQTTNGALVQAESDSYFTTAYTMENTTLDNNTDHATAIVFEGYELKGLTQTIDGATTTTYDWGAKKKTYRFVIRHSDPNGDANAKKPMLYSVVRNNIYRFTLSKVLLDEFNPVIVVEYWDPNNHTVETILVEQIKDVTEDWHGSYPNDTPRRR